MLEPEKRKVRRAGRYSNVSAPAPIPAPEREIEYQVEHFSSNDGSRAQAVYQQSSNTIKYYHIDGVQQNWFEFKATLAHEGEHHDNANEGEKGIQGYWMSLEQYYKICRYNEISASIAEVLLLREEYIHAKTNEERKLIAESYGGRFTFYFNAIERGMIDPFTSDPDKFMEEMKFIAQGTQEMWMKDHLDGYNKNSFPKRIKKKFKTLKYFGFFGFILLSKSTRIN